MRDYFAANRLVTARFRAAGYAVVIAAAVCVLAVSANTAAAESTATELVIRPPASATKTAHESKPPKAIVLTRGRAKQPRPAAITKPAAKLNRRMQTKPREINLQSRAVGRINVGAQPSERARANLRQINFQEPPAGAPQRQSLQLDLVKDPCAAMDEKPLAALGIGISLPTGKLPDDPATACWDQLNGSAGPLAGMRCWPMHVCNWNATCICHRPLYFEQINLERHGYGCCEALQPMASAAHFFATLPALPYCMATECPCECVYTLGHYRPGSCPPWRHHWPPCSPLAAAAEGGVWTGLVFLIP